MDANTSGAAGRDEVDSRASWKMAWVTLAILSVSYGSPLLIVVGMRPMQEALGIDRSALALAGSLVWVGTGAGGILMGWLADRIGVRNTVIIGACMIAGGLALSSLGSMWAVYVGQGLMVGLLGNGAVYPPLLVYVSRWFNRRRGAAIALISSRSIRCRCPVADAFRTRPFVHRLADAHAGLWRPSCWSLFFPTTFLLEACARRARAETGAVDGHPEKPRRGPPSECRAGPSASRGSAAVSRWRCRRRIVAFCGDIGIPPTHGAAMLSVMLGSAFLRAPAVGRPWPTGSADCGR